MNPAAVRPSRKAVIMGVETASDVLRRKPTVGMAGCCARAASGHAAAVPPCRRAAEERDELSPPHSITSSAVASRVVGMVRPRAFAVLRLMTNSYLDGACTG